jgi:hypothetical protein
MSIAPNGITLLRQKLSGSAAVLQAEAVGKASLSEITNVFILPII